MNNSKSTLERMHDIFAPVNLEQSFNKLKTLSAYIITFDDRHAVVVNSYCIEAAEIKAKEWMQRKMRTWVKMVSCEVEEVL